MIGQILTHCIPFWGINFIGKILEFNNLAFRSGTEGLTHIIEQKQFKIHSIAMRLPEAPYLFAIWTDKSVFMIKSPWICLVETGMNEHNIQIRTVIINHQSFQETIVQSIIWIQFGKFLNVGFNFLLRLLVLLVILFKIMLEQGETLVIIFLIEETIKFKFSPHLIVWHIQGMGSSDESVFVTFTGSALRNHLIIPGRPINIIV
ncbi:hypothetical protein AWRI1631_100290 [Saccharomyces cerevisiae AWRI1631]|uniref:Uncharacterized protein n=1 Tax=Saccharomyces cerevisiae (strain AWRI1631) TaxID=545124 RepID=B5VL05_YEAS6|nr:hypothetical protein AWRI1631_100290 [Saccharomyces cerevisiae AWRI1631]